MTFGLGAKLFGIAALVIAVIAVVPVKVTGAMFDLYFHETYFAVPARHAFLWFALLCGTLAAFYYLGDRALGHRWHNGLTIGHFFALDSLGCDLCPGSKLGRACKFGRSLSK